jgi:hypothetical protein
MAVTPPKKGRGWDLANTNIQEWIKLFQGVGVMKVYISTEKNKKLHLQYLHLGFQPSAKAN